MLNYISQDPKERQRYLSRKMALMDMNAAISTARAEGRQEGKAEGKAEMLQRLLIRRFGDLPNWAIEKLHNASSPQLESWFEKALDASDLDALFK